MGKLSKVYDVVTNIRGLAKLGYCRPTVKNLLLGVDDKYAPTWCGGGMPPDWFPEEDWDGYPTWPADLGAQPGYDGPFKPKHPDVPWPSPDLKADGTTGGETATEPGAPWIESVSIDGITATLTVIPPEDGDGGSEILYYTATSTPHGITGTGTMGEENVTIEVTGLTPGTEYTFVVTATNAVGTSTPSDPSESVLATEVESGNNIAFNVYDTNHETAPIEGGTNWKFIYESSSIKEFNFDYSSNNVAPVELEFANWPNDTYGCYITKIEFLESGSWVDRTAPANWAVHYDISWNGSAWAMTGSGRLDGSNTFAINSYRPTKIRLTYSIYAL